MAVSKRTRFEVLRRDNYTCRYCGAKAPEVALTVDHVTPVALGGSDRPDNLTAACTACNSGKTSTSPDDRTVADVSEKAVALGKALRDALAEAGKRLADDQRWHDKVEDHWWDAAERCGYRSARMGDGWERSVSHWRQIGVPENVVLNAIDTAMSKRKISAGGKWRYTCGVVWRVIDEASEVTGIAPRKSRKCGHCGPCVDPDQAQFDGECSVYNPLDEDPELCPQCGKAECVYWRAYNDGVQDGMQHEWSRNVDAIKHYKTCTQVKK